MIFWKFLNERLMTEAKIDPLFPLQQTEIGILHDFAKIRQRKGSQGKTNSDRFLGPNLPQKGPLCDLCHNRTKNWLFLMAFTCIKFKNNRFGIKFASSVLFSFGISFSRQILNPLPSSNSLVFDKKFTVLSTGG